MCFLIAIWWAWETGEARVHTPGQTDRQRQTETDNTALYTMQKFDNEHAKSSCAPPNRYEAMLCTTEVHVNTELHCQPWFACLLPTTKILMSGATPTSHNIGPPCAPWCTTQVDGAQCSPVPMSWCTTYIAFTNPDTQTRDRKYYLFR